MTSLPETWLLLVVSLPKDGATARMRIWRALKALGCGALRDGAYLLPDRDPLRERLGALADETKRAGGSAWLLTVNPETGSDGESYRTLFDRSEDLASLTGALLAARPTLAVATPVEINRLLRKLRRDCEAVNAIDYFPNEASRQAEAAWMDFSDLAETLLSPGEPQAIDADVLRRDRKDFQARMWATRRQLWVDRVASAWLIRRFIDQEARFLWLAAPADCPADALGFDFDGAAFPHVGERVTFEVLLASFGLAQDRGLARLGAMIHALDVGGAFVPEAAGFEAMLGGARQRAPDDDQLLAEMSVVFDSLYTHFAAEPQAVQDKP